MDKDLRLKPNALQFFNFNRYLYDQIIPNESVQKAGIVVVVVPEGVWTSSSDPILEKTFKLSGVQINSFERVKDGVYLQYYSKIENRDMTPIEFFEKSKEFILDKDSIDVFNPKRDATKEELDDFEKILFKDFHLRKQIYGTSFEETLFTPGQISWNLRKLVKENELYLCGASSEGVTVPMLIFSAGGSTFILHTENENLAAINYLHWGAPKVWFAFSNKYYLAVIRIIGIIYKDCEDPRRKCKNFPAHKLCFIDPKILDAHSIPYTRVSLFF